MNLAYKFAKEMIIVVCNFKGLVYNYGKYGNMWRCDGFVKDEDRWIGFQHFRMVLKSGLTLLINK
jgi:hypothetical protein